jgi:hypothetical protein
MYGNVFLFQSKGLTKKSAGAKRSAVATGCAFLFSFFGFFFAELKRTNLSQSISPLSLQNTLANSLVNF